MIDGLTGDQRVFLGWAQVWREKQRPEAAIQQTKSDPHSAAQFRVIGPTRNNDGWYAAFGVKPGDKYYLPPERARADLVGANLSSHRMDLNGSSTSTQMPWMWLLLMLPGFRGANHANGHKDRSRATALVCAETRQAQR